MTCLTQQVLTLNAEVNGNVTILEPRPPAPGSLDNTHIAVGYSDGSVAVFDLRVRQPLKFTGIICSIFRKKIGYSHIFDNCMCYFVLDLVHNMYVMEVDD